MTYSPAPVLITAPSAQVVTLAEAKAHLRVDHADEDDVIEGFIAAAVAYLDGWQGVLGRGIMPQTWRQEFADWGDLQLAMPDVVDASVTVQGFDAEGGTVVPTATEILRTCGGIVVSAAGPAVAKVRVTYQVALPAHRLPAAKALVKLIVGAFYDGNRGDAGGGGSGDDLMLSPAARGLMGSLRWMKV